MRRKISSFGPQQPGEKRTGIPHRRLSVWCPGAASVRPLAQSAFVDEDDRAALVFGLFKWFRRLLQPNRLGLFGGLLVGAFTLARDTLPTNA
jgi:hypothetical protein